MPINSLARLEMHVEKTMEMWLFLRKPDRKTLMSKVSRTNGMRVRAMKKTMTTKAFDNFKPSFDQKRSKLIKASRNRLDLSVELSS